MARDPTPDLSDLTEPELIQEQAQHQEAGE